MKLLSLFLFAALVVSVTSCETTREITFNDQGAGTVSTSMDLSALIGLAKLSGQAKDFENEKPLDTTMSTVKFADSLNLSTEEKAIAQNGTLRMVMNLPKDQLNTKLTFPFSDFKQLELASGLSGKATRDIMMKQLGNGKVPDMPENALPKSSIDDYFTVVYTKNSIEKKLIPEKYAALASDSGIQALKEMSEQGMPMNTKLIFNLPRIVKAATGKGVEVSDDKKKVTVEESVDQFFNDAKGMEFRIEF